MKKIFLLGVLVLSLTACDRRPNARDSENTAMTQGPMDQAETEADRALVQRIRRAILADQALSNHARNIKIISVNGVVTLRGPVLTPKERDAILRRVHEIGGIERVENQLEVAPAP